MKYAQIIFSPVGGTLKAAKAVSDTWAKSVETFDLTKPDFDSAVFQKEDLVLIAVPSFAGRVPKPAVQRLAGVRGNGACCVLLCVYGNRAYEDTLVELQDTAEKQGFQVLAAIAAVAEHSIAHQYAAGRPDKQDAETLQEFSLNILRAFHAGQTNIHATIPGNRPYKTAGGSSLVPQAGETCAACGLCAAHCPTEAISRVDLRTADPEKCCSCMRCAARCPYAARHADPIKAAAIIQALQQVCSVRKECELFI